MKVDYYNDISIYYNGIRYFDPINCIWRTGSSFAEKFFIYQSNIYIFDIPVNFTDPTGMVPERDNPVFDYDGSYRGNTKEGYTGDIIIYDGNKDFTKMTANELLYDNFNAVTQLGDGNTYDRVRHRLSENAKSKIWTHIASQFEGQQVYDEVFSMSDLEGSKIYVDLEGLGSWNAEPKSMYQGWNDRITGTDKYEYESTVENIQSSVVVHEWYSHIKKGQGNFPYLKSHRLAYKNVINYKKLWNNTTDKYKRFNMKALRKYTEDETGRFSVDPIYRNLYNKYVNKR